jgi:transposase
VVKILPNVSSNEKAHGNERNSRSSNNHEPSAIRYVFTATLYLALELGATTWQLGFTSGLAQRPRERTIPAGAMAPLLEEIHRAKERFALPLDTPVVSCYEAGRDGFWLHRCLQSHGITHLVVDSASIASNRRQRRAKIDRLDLQKLLTMLLRYQSGEHKVWRVVQVPSGAEEDRRHLHRDLLTAKRDRTRAVNRLQGLLAGYGIRLALQGDVEAKLDQGRQGDGSPLLPALCNRLKRAWQQVQFLTTHSRTLEAERRAARRSQDDAAVAPVKQLFTLRGVGIKSAWLYIMEFVAWREFQTPKHIGA